MSVSKNNSNDIKRFIFLYHRIRRQLVRIPVLNKIGGITYKSLKLLNLACFHFFKLYENWLLELNAIQSLSFNQIALAVVINFHFANK